MIPDEEDRGAGECLCKLRRNDRDLERISNMSRHLSDSMLTFSMRIAAFVSMSIMVSSMLRWKGLRNSVISWQQLLSVLGGRHKDSICEIVLRFWSKGDPG